MQLSGQSITGHESCDGESTGVVEASRGTHNLHHGKNGGQGEVKSKES